MATMGFRSRTLVIWTVVIGLIGLGVVVMPSSGASAPSSVRLHLGTDGQYFAYGATTQPLKTAKNGCQLTSAEPLIDLSSTGPSNQSSPGLASYSIGVKGSPSSGNGTPCSETDQTETLKLSRGPSLGSRPFSGVRLDLEMRGNAIVLLTLATGSTSATYRLQTGTSITPAQAAEPDYDTTEPYFVSSGPGDEEDGCASPNSSGPNSGGSDNCQWTVLPGFDFDTITLTASIGTVSLEGGGDFGNSPSFETLLYLGNTAPTANPDTYATDEDTPLLGNVLSNDSDPDGDSLTASVVTGPSNGTLSLSTNGAFTYSPAANWFGTDSFVYAASDGTTSSTATATITVRSVNDPPVAASGTATTPEDTPVTVTVATDVDSTVLTSSCTSSGGGTIVDNGDGSVVFTPPLNFNGTVVLTCSTTDDQGATTTSQATVSVGVTPVNDPPVAVDDSADVDADSSVVIPVLANDSDVDGDTLSVTDIAQVSPTGATAVANPDGTVTYTPPEGYDGPGSFTYRAYDGSASSGPATVTIAVFPVICSLATVSDTDGAVTGSFTRLNDPHACKRYTVAASAGDDTILFSPEGDATVAYRGVLSFGADPAPGSGSGGAYSLLLRYDRLGGNTFTPVPWCVDPQFDADDAVISATLPPGIDTWCVASADTRGNSAGDLVTTWQVYGEDDPKFTR